MVEFRVTPFSFLELQDSEETSGTPAHNSARQCESVRYGPKFLQQFQAAGIVLLHMILYGLDFLVRYRVL